MERVARAACLSRFHFHRLFAEAPGETPHRYITRRRLEKAQDLLAATDLPVTSVSLAAGFESLGSFSSLFRRRFGSSPRGFRRAREKSNLREEPDTGVSENCARKDRPETVTRTGVLRIEPGEEE